MTTPYPVHARAGDLLRDLHLLTRERKGGEGPILPAFLGTREPQSVLEHKRA